MRPLDITPQEEILFIIDIAMKENRRITKTEYAQIERLLSGLELNAEIMPVRQFGAPKQD